MEEEKCCRICLSNDIEANDSFISPCKCKGTVRYVHVLCLERWRASRPDGEPICSICKSSYSGAAARKLKRDSWLAWQQFKHVLFTRPTNLLARAVSFIAMQEGLRIAAIHATQGFLLALRTGHVLLQDQKATLVVILGTIRRAMGRGTGVHQAAGGEEVKLTGVAGVLFLILELGLSFSLGRVWGQALLPLAAIGGLGGAVHGFVKGYFRTYIAAAGLVFDAGGVVGSGLRRVAMGLLFFLGRRRSGGRGGQAGNSLV